MYNEKSIHLHVDPIFWNHLKRARQSNSDVIQDIYDGEEYRKMMQPGQFLSQPNVLSLTGMVNTDGVALYRSSSTNIWPIYLVINELPPSVR